MLANRMRMSSGKRGQPLSNLAVGTLVKDNMTKYYNEPIVWKVADKNHAGYPLGAITLISDKIIKIACFDAKEPLNSNDKRRDYGNNRYIWSNIRQWLNSNATSGAWYSAQHSWDAPPSSANVWNGNNHYEAQVGFLNGFSEKFINAIQDTTLVVGKPLLDGGGTETCVDKIFLPSFTEVGGTTGTFVEGSKFALFINNNSRLAYPTVEAVNNSTYTNVGLSKDTPWTWWTRSIYSENNYYDVCYIDAAGSVGGYISHAYMGTVGIRPACNLPAAILVSNDVDSDGCYVLI